MRELLNLCLANAVVVTFLAVPAYCVSRWAKRPALAHVLWLLILIKLVTPPLWRVTLALPVSQTASFDKTPNPESPTVEPAPVTASDTNPAEIEIPAVVEQPVNNVPILESAVPTSAPLPVAFEPTPPPDASAELPLEIPWQNVVGFWWLAGSSIVFGLAIWRLSAFARCLHRVQPALPSMQALSEELSQNLGLKFAPRVGIAPIRMAPLVWGLGHWSRVIIPAELWQSLDPEQRAMLLVHELAHLRRGDHWVRWLELLVRGIYWWHPVVWLAGREMREAEEQCCDAWAVWALPHAAKAYARALVDTVDFLSERSVPLPVGASGIGQFQDLRRRLIMIMRGTTPRKLSASTLAGLVVLGGALVVLGPSFGQQRQSEDVQLTEDPFQQPVPVAARPPRVVTADSDDLTKAAEITRLRQQEANLHQTMDTLARALEQTKRQLRAAQGEQAPTEDVVPVPRAPRDSARARNTAPRATTPRPPATVTPSEDQPRARPSRERPVEERLSRLEEQMSQIAHDLHALRSNSPLAPPNAPTHPAPAALPRSRPQPSADPFGQPGLAPPTNVDPLAPPAETPGVPAPPAPVRPRRPPNDTIAPPALAPRPGAPVEPSAVAPPAPPVPDRPQTINSRTFSIPFIIPDEQKDKIRHVLLYVSSDNGKNWLTSAVHHPADKGSFPYTAPTDGSYWFKVSTVDGNREPNNIQQLGVIIKVQVDTSTPEAEPSKVPFVVTSQMVEDYVGKDAEVKGFQNELNRAKEQLAKFNAAELPSKDVPEFSVYLAKVTELQARIESRKEEIRPEIQKRLEQVSVSRGGRLSLYYPQLTVKKAHDSLESWAF